MCDGATQKALGTVLGEIQSKCLVLCIPQTQHPILGVPLTRQTTSDGDQVNNMGEILEEPEGASIRRREMTASDFEGPPL